MAAPHWEDVSRASRQAGGDEGPRIEIPREADTRRWVGLVVGVGPLVKQLEFGDLVEVTRWETESSEWHNALWKLLGHDAEGDDIYFPDPDSGRVVAGKCNWRLAWFDEHEVIYRVARYGEYDDGWIEPLGTRIVVRHEPRKDTTQSGIQLISKYYRAPPRLAQVVSVGRDVEWENMIPGDWVLVPPEEGSIVTTKDCEMTILESRHVMVNYKSYPPRRVEMAGTAA